MRQFITLFIFSIVVAAVNAQTLDELKVKRTELKKHRAKKQAEANAFNGEITSLTSQIELLSGWNWGYSGLIGLDLSKSTKWAANPNPNSNSTALNVGITIFGNRKQEKYFWNNKGIISKAWKDLDISDDEDDGLESTVDIINISSLYGYKLNDKIAISVLGEFNTSIGNFFNPGTFDIGTGATWTPIKDMTVVLHPFNLHSAFSGFDNVDSEVALGTKLRVDYSKSILIQNNSLVWSTTFTMFNPYKSKDPTLFEYTWLNTFSYEIWKGFGLGFNFGIRKAEFEVLGTQSFYSLGISYKIN